LRTYRRERIRCESCETTSGGGAQSQLIPWMRASYIMVAHKAALRYLPDGADINALGYVQLGAWAGPIEQKSGKRLSAFRPGHKGSWRASFTRPRPAALWSRSARKLPKQCGASSRRYGRASTQTRRATILCSSHCSLATSGSVSITLPACSARCGKAGLIYSIPGAVRPKGTRLHAGAGRARRA